MNYTENANIRELINKIINKLSFNKNINTLFV